MDKARIINEFQIKRDFIRLINEGFPIPNLKSLFGMIGKNADDLVKSFGDDAAKNIEYVISKAFSNPMNIGVDDLGRQCIKSGSGGTLPLKTLSSVLDGISLGYFNIDDIATTLPRYLPDGTEFRDVFKKSLIRKTVKNQIKQLSGRQFVDKFKLGDVGFPKYFDGLTPNELTQAQKTELSEFYKHWTNMTDIALSNVERKINNIANNSFNPSKVNVISQSNFSGRELIEVQIENGETIIFYSSSGSNVATTGKKKGEWFIIPGFMDNCITLIKETNTYSVFNDWFAKTDKSIALTKGGNNYLTEMAQFLEKNGVEGLSK